MSRTHLKVSILVLTLAAGAAWLRISWSPSRTPPPAVATRPSEGPPSSALARQSTAVQTLAPRTTEAPSTSAVPPSEAPADVAAVGVAGQRAYIDPKTGRLREREHDDVVLGQPGAIGSARRRGIQTGAPQTIAGPDGAVTVVVPDELHTFMVATRQPDGSIVLEHATGPKAARAQVGLGSKSTNVAGKGEPNDR